MRVWEGFISGIETRSFGERPEVLSSFEKLLDSEEGRARLGDLGRYFSGETKEVFRIFSGKFPKAIIEKLEARSLLKEGFGGKIYLPRHFALHYLSLCAASAASTYQFDLCADAEIFADSAIVSQQEVRATIATRILKSYFPRNLDTLPIETVIELRHELSTERLRYATAIQGIVDEFSKVASHGQLEILQKRVEDIAKQRIEETRNVYRCARLEAIMKALAISLAPSSLSALPSLLGIGIFTPAAIAAGVSLGAADFLLRDEKARADLASSPWSYVLKVQKRLR